MKDSNIHYNKTNADADERRLRRWRYKVLNLFTISHLDCRLQIFFLIFFTVLLFGLPRELCTLNMAQKGLLCD